ncbi:saccharopine dehydrogenase [Streptomyces ipomoeae]|uniref:Saccharopine dehydrogenase [NAD(+), L-lysine-forming] n=1 Tax=Streptomyces ipomoeae TaxID=103232 RepID=A0AAE8W1V9_9ACTN|nr:saccharopine dehydrogenase [Streptomyces ipomoeae]TQE28397.1 saccharopine dehydrogenase [Streptomyces ipomoeae]
MPAPPRLWLRHETRATERRAPLVPDDAAHLIGQGVEITVEESPQRVFPLAEYVRAGCASAPAGSWVEAPGDTYVLGLKELPAQPRALRHRHIYFGHAYKGQSGAGDLLDRFTAGGGTLLDLEYLTDDDGRRLAAFGHWAGYVGAALAVLHRRGMLETPLRPLDRPGWDALLRAGSGGGRALVIGALGRSGRGACDALETAGISPVRWDLAETRELDRAALLGHDILVNAVLVTRLVPPFLTPADLDSPGRRLSVVADVTCDVNSECNVLPVHDTVTDWERPARRLRGGDHPVDVIAVDNLPALLPVESSRAFSAELWPQLLRLGGGAGAWVRCLRAFAGAIGAGAVRAGAVGPRAVRARVKEATYVR